MSYDIYFERKQGERNGYDTVGDSFINYASGSAAIIKDVCGAYPSKWDGLKAETLIERLQNGCEELKKNPEQFKIFEVFDDTVENARSFLETLLSNCIRYPTAYIRVYY